MPYSFLKVLSKYSSEPDGTHLSYREGVVEQLITIALNERFYNLSQEVDSPFIQAFVGGQMLNINTKADSAAVVIKAEQYQQAATVLFTEIKRIHSYGITQGELDRAVKQLVANIDASYKERDKTTSQKFAAELVRVVTTKEDVPGIVYEQKLIHHYTQEITLVEVNEVLKTWLSSEGQIVHLITGNEQRPTAEDLKKWRDETLETSVEKPSENLVLEPLLGILPKSGHITAHEEIEEIGVEKLTLSNGAKVWLKNTDFQADKVFFSSMQQGGYSQVEDEWIVPAKTAVSIARLSGGGQHDLQQLRQLLVGTMVGVSPYFYRDRHGFRGSSPGSNLETLFQLHHVLSQESRFEQEAFIKTKQMKAEALRNKENNPQQLFADEGTRLWWNNHPRYTNWNLDRLEEMDLAKSAQFFRQSMSAISGSDIVLMGNLDKTVLLPLIEQYLAQPSEVAIPQVITRPDPRIQQSLKHTVYAGVEPVAHYEFSAIAHADLSFLEQISRHAVIQLLQLKLRRLLREERGDVYSVGVNIAGGKVPTQSQVLTINFSTDP
jgi:zinc protease